MSCWIAPTPEFYEEMEEQRLAQAGHAQNAARMAVGEKED